MRWSCVVLHWVPPQSKRVEDSVLKTFEQLIDAVLQKLRFDTEEVSTSDEECVKPARTPARTHAHELPLSCQTDAMAALSNRFD